MSEWTSQKHRTRLLVGGFALALALSPQAVSAQSLAETLELTWRTNPTLKAQRAGFDATQELRAQARAGGMPTVNAQVSYEATEGNYDPGQAGAPVPGAGTGSIFEAFSGNGSPATTRAGIEAQQPLFQGFRVRNGVLEADARISAARADLMSTEQQILFDAVAAYFQVVTSTESVRASEATVQSLDSQLSAARARFDAGQGTLTDTAQAEARFAGAGAELIRTRSDLLAARKQFERIVGQMPVNLEQEPALPAIPATMDLAVADALRNNPQLLSARAEHEAAERNVKVAKGFLSPSLTASARFGYVEGQFIEGDESQNTVVGAQLTIPIFQGGETYSRIRQAEAVSRSQRHFIDATERAVMEQVQVAWERVTSARAGYEASLVTINANEVALRGLILENRSGLRTTLDVLDGERELLAARLTTYQARQQYYLACYALLQVTGQLTAAGLGLADAAQVAAPAGASAARSAAPATPQLFDRR